MNRYPYNHGRCQQGLSLIELLVVMLLAGMLTSWGIGQWHLYQQALRLEQTAQQLLAFLTRLQADANWRNRNALLWFKQGEPWCVGSGTAVIRCTSAAGWVFTPVYIDVQLQDFTQKEMGFYGLRNNAQQDISCWAMAQAAYVWCCQPKDACGCAVKKRLFEVLPYASLRTRFYLA